MVKSHGDFVAIVDLPEGEHQFKYYVDGEWKNDPHNKIIDGNTGIYIHNKYCFLILKQNIYLEGEKINLITVKQSDFEVFQALAKDQENAKDDAQKEFSQEIPIHKPWEKNSGPPVLPPHLLQVILNKDTPLSVGFFDLYYI